MVGGDFGRRFCFCWAGPVIPLFESDLHTYCLLLKIDDISLSSHLSEAQNEKGNHAAVYAGAFADSLD